MRKAPDPIPLCRYEELAQRENRLREASVTAQATAAEQFRGAHDLKGHDVDVPDGLTGGEG